MPEDHNTALTPEQVNDAKEAIAVALAHVPGKNDPKNAVVVALMDVQDKLDALSQKVENETVKKADIAQEVAEFIDAADEARRLKREGRSNISIVARLYKRLDGFFARSLGLGSEETQS